jgi:ketosteroid isomerase-like protein
LTAAEQRELHELVERYAQAADRPDGAAVAALFAEDGVLALWMDPSSPEPTGEHVGRTAIAEAVDRISRYDATHHTISSHTSVVEGVTATGETLCTAHHVSVQGKKRSDRVLYIRYLDSFVRSTSAWQFGRREMHVQWASTLPVDD